jgi:hypothetical protein
MSLGTALGNLQRLLANAAALPTYPADATLLTAEAICDVAMQWRDVATRVRGEDPAGARAAIDMALTLEDLAVRAARRATLLAALGPTPTRTMAP